MSKDEAASSAKRVSSSPLKNPKIRIAIETYFGKNIYLNAHVNDTVLAVKNKLHYCVDIPVHRQRLVFRNEELQDSSKLSEHNIGNGATLKLLICMRGGPITTLKKIHVDSELVKMLSNFLKNPKGDKSTCGSHMDCDEEDSTSDLTDEEKEEDGDDEISTTSSGLSPETDIRIISCFTVGNAPKNITRQKHESKKKKKENKEKKQRIGFKERVQNKVTMKKMDYLKERLKGLSLNEVTSRRQLNDSVDISASTISPFRKQGIPVVPQMLPQPVVGVGGKSVEDHHVNTSPIKYYDEQDDVKDKNIVTIVNDVMQQHQKSEMKTEKITRPMKCARKCSVVTTESETEGRASSEGTTDDDLSGVEFDEGLEIALSNGGLVAKIGENLTEEQKCNSAVNYRISFMDMARLLGHIPKECCCNIWSEDKKQNAPSSSTAGTSAAAEPTKEEKGTLPPINSTTTHVVNKSLDCSIEKKQKKNRCAQCRRKLGLATTYTCRCMLSFCSEHRYAEAHMCTFDYKKEGKEIIRKNNPLIVAEKLPKI